MTRRSDVGDIPEYPNTSLYGSRPLVISNTLRGRQTLPNCFSTGNLGGFLIAASTQVPHAAALVGLSAFFSLSTDRIILSVSLRGLG